MEQTQRLVWLDKVPGFSGTARRLAPSVAILSVILLAIAYGLTATLLGLPGHTPSKTIVNIFWCAWNGVAVWLVVRLIWWSPLAELEALKAMKTNEVTANE